MGSLSPGCRTVSRRAHTLTGYQPIDLRVQRGGQPRSLKLVMTEPARRTWSTRQLLRVLAFYFIRFILLVLAILVALSRPERLRARLAALMLAIAAVAEGYPSSGWAAALRHLPAVFGIPICLATASCLLAPMVWLAFSALDTDCFID